MFNKDKLKGFICGICVATILSATTVFAANIDVFMGGIRVFWDGVEKTLTDVNGNKVEPMIYNGTTYVPLRAMGKLMGKEVGWNQQEMSVYVGEQPTAATTPLDKLPKEKIVGGQFGVYTGEYSTYNKKDQVITCENILREVVRKSGVYELPKNPSFTCILDNNYTKFVAEAVFPYTSIGSSETGTITFYSVTDKGEETEIASYEVTQTEDPIDVDVNLKGVANLKIVFSRYDLRMFDISLLGK